MRRSVLAAALFVVPILPVAAQDLPQLRVAMSQDADALDPTLSRAYVQRVATLNMCDGLFTYNDKLAIVPRLATGYEWADSRTLVVKLRPGVTFHDGTPVDAAAIKYSMERHATMSGSARKGGRTLSLLELTKRLDAVQPGVDHPAAHVLEAARLLSREDAPLLDVVGVDRVRVLPRAGRGAARPPLRHRRPRHPAVPAAARRPGGRR